MFIIDNQQPFFYKKIYKESNLKVSDIVGVLVTMLILIPIAINHANKQASTFSIFLSTGLVLALILFGDFMFRFWVLPQLQAIDYSGIKGRSLPKSLGYILFTALLFGIVFFIMGFGVWGLIVVSGLYILLKSILAFFPKVLAQYLSFIRPTLFSYYKHKSIDFKYKYSISLVSSIGNILLPFIIAFIYGNISDLLCINSFWILFPETYLKIIAAILLVGIGFFLIKMFELKSMKNSDNWQDYLTESNKKAGAISIALWLIILIVFLTGNVNGFG